VVEAPQAGARLPRVGYLCGGSESPREAAFRQGFREHGYIEGQNIAIEYRLADGKFKRLPRFAVEQPTKTQFELVINLKTAKALGLTIPQSILVRADEIIR
jgi:putative ABC transport system substrate-binding protein